MLLGRKVTANSTTVQGTACRWRLASYRGRSTTAAVHHQHPQSLRTVDDLPTPGGGNKWLALWRTIFPGDKIHKTNETLSRSIQGRLYRVPIPFLSHAIVNTTDPEHVAAMFRNEGELPHRPGGENLVWLLNKKGFGTGLVFDNWEEWRALRSKSNKQIVPRKVLEFTPLIYDVAGDVVQYFRDHRGVNNYVDSILEPLMDWSFEGIGIFILGERLQVFSNFIPRMKKFQNAGISFIEGIVPMFSIIPWYRFFPTPASIRFVEAVHQLEEITKELIEEKIAKLVKSGISEDECVGFLDRWLMDDKFNKEDIFVLVRDFLSAGIDTTSVTATSMLYALARNPDVQERLREEVLSVVGEHDVPTVQHLQKLHFAKNIITETLRVHPIIAGLIRAIGQDVTLDGYHIPKGTWMISDNYSMSRDPTIFEDPLKFNPDRWTRESKKKSAFAHLPFGFGPRACYGRRMAELELSLLLVQISRNFNLDTDLVELESAGTTVLKPTTPVKIQFNDR